MIGWSVVAGAAFSLFLMAIVGAMVLLMERQDERDEAAARGRSRRARVVTLSAGETGEELEAPALRAEVGAFSDLASVLANARREREAYRHAKALRLLEADSAIERLARAANMATGEQRRELEDELMEIQVRRVNLGIETAAVGVAPLETWTELRPGLDSDINALQSMIESAAESVHEYSAEAHFGGGAGRESGMRISASAERNVALTYAALSDDALIDEAGDESFPASDPPSWTCGMTRRPPPTEYGVPTAPH